MRTRHAAIASLVACAIAFVACSKSPASPPGPRQCKADDECVLSCDHEGSCCHNPYCESAMHRDDAADARAYNEKHCTPEDRAKCPVIGARVQPDYRVTPRCRSGACVAEKSPLLDGSAARPD